LAPQSGTPLSLCADVSSLIGSAYTTSSCKIFSSLYFRTGEFFPYSDAVRFHILNHEKFNKKTVYLDCCILCFFSSCKTVPKGTNSVMQ
jgi:hypothetical protein